MNKKVKNKKEQDKDNQELERLQTEYNNNPTKENLWAMAPYWKDLIMSALKVKMVGLDYNVYTPEELNDLADEGTEIILNRFIKDPKKHYNLPKTAAYWMTITLLYSIHISYKPTKELAYYTDCYQSYDTFEDDIIEKLTREGY